MPEAPAGPGSSASARSAARRRRRRRVFIALSLLLPVLVLLGLEAGFRLAGWGGYPPTFRQVGTLENGSKLIITDNAGPSSYFFANRKRPGTLHEEALEMPKPAGTFRIMFAGESAAKGFPQPRALAASAFFEAMLGDLHPDKRIEVINLGCTAVASFPVMEMVTESLDYSPDLVVLYVGNNEFYGAYGVASLHAAGRSPRMIRFTRWLHSLAFVQAIDDWRAGEQGMGDKTLMEAMVGQSSIASDDPMREAAAANLREFVGETVRRCRERGVEVVVCVPPFNERDLAPLGAAEAQPAAAAFRDGQYPAAVDLDPMPWRPPSICLDMIKQAAHSSGAVFCDLAAGFRRESDGGAIGWELMDDHVHPSLRGQDLVARSVCRSMAELEGPLRTDPGAVDALPPFEAYAARLGDNEYDRYGVAHQMRVLANIPFFKETNPGFFTRMNGICEELGANWSPAIRDIAVEWQKPETHRGGEKRPITAMVGRQLIREGKVAEAERLFDVAARSVSEYSSWNVEYTYFMLAARERVRGSLSEDDRAVALAACLRGQLLLGQGRSGDGQLERYVGRLRQLRGEHDLAIPMLLTAREKLGAMDYVANDQALIESYAKSGRPEKAREIVDAGIKGSGQYAELYRRMGQALEKK